jgi:hypothetical protein
MALMCYVIHPFFVEWRLTTRYPKNTFRMVKARYVPTVRNVAFECG